MVKKIIILLAIFAGFGLIVHNAYYYPVDEGYDAGLHMRYARIISHEWRFPTFQESRENYNPPLFYLTSGLIGRLASAITKKDFFIALKIWQYVSIALAAFSLYLWFIIIKQLHPQNQTIQTGFLVLLFSIPVFHKTIVMFSIETFFLFTVSLTFWYFFCRFQSRPNFKTTLLLSLLTIMSLLTRMSAFVLFLTLGAGFLGLGFIKKIKWTETIKLLFVFIVLVSLGTGWFYFGRRNQRIYNAGEHNRPDIPLFERQPASFYTDVPFKVMMTHPIRLYRDSLNQLIPIYYSEFWGDFWNYYSQRRFNVFWPEKSKMALNVGGISPGNYRITLTDTAFSAEDVDQIKIETQGKVGFEDISTEWKSKKWSILHPWSYKKGQKVLKMTSRYYKDFTLNDQTDYIYLDNQGKELYLTGDIEIQSIPQRKALHFYNLGYDKSKILKPIPKNKVNKETLMYYNRYTNNEMKRRLIARGIDGPRQLGRVDAGLNLPGKYRRAIDDGPVKLSTSKEARARKDYTAHVVKRRSPEKKDRYLFSQARVKSLARQNRVNLLPTLLIILGFIYLLIKSIKTFLFQKKSSTWLAQSIFILFTVLTWLGFLALNTMLPSWKGDSVKASYMLYNLPIFIYFITIFLFKPIKKSKIIFVPAIICLSVSTVINLFWSWY